MSCLCLETTSLTLITTLRPRRNEQHFADDIFKHIFFNENVWISIKISLKFVPKGPINNIPALVQIMALRRPGDKPLSEQMMVSLPTHICVIRPQWVKDRASFPFYRPKTFIHLWAVNRNQSFNGNWTSRVKSLQGVLLTSIPEKPQCECRIHTWGSDTEW